MKLFVTGATGFLGDWVVREALSAGHAVRALIRPNAQPELPEGAESAPASLLDADALLGAIEGCDAVIHLAGRVSRAKRDAPEMHEVHVEGTRALLSAMSRAGIRRLVLASTSGTIGLRQDKLSSPATEDEVPDFELLGKFPYYTSKLYQEQEVLRRRASGDIDPIILNPSLLLGPGDRRLSSTSDVLEILNRRVPAVSDGTMALVDVRDVAPMFVRALEAGRVGERYLLNGANMSVKTFVQRVGVAGDVMGPTLKVSNKWAVRGAKLVSGLFESLDRDPPLDPVAVEMSTLHWDVDASRARQDLGFEARDPQSTIEATVRDLENRGLFRRSR
ncbi:MAG: NAD-dependent epimerase/dehydratase family protein [Myxococcota bacterium]